MTEDLINRIKKREQVQPAIFFFVRERIAMRSLQQGEEKKCTNTVHNFRRCLRFLEYFLSSNLVSFCENNFVLQLKFRKQMFRIADYPLGENEKKK